MSTAIVKGQAELTESGEEFFSPIDPDFVDLKKMKLTTPLKHSVSNNISAILKISKPELPNTQLLVGIGDPRLKVKKAFPVEISSEPDLIVAHFHEIDEFGYGESTSEAVDDLSKTLGELFFELESRNKELGQDLSRVRQILWQYFEPVHLYSDENS